MCTLVTRSAKVTDKKILSHLVKQQSTSHLTHLILTESQTSVQRLTLPHLSQMFMFTLVAVLSQLQAHHQVSLVTLMLSISPVP